MSKNDAILISLILILVLILILIHSDLSLNPSPEPSSSSPFMLLQGTQRFASAFNIIEHSTRPLQRPIGFNTTQPTFQ